MKRHLTERPWRQTWSWSGKGSYLVYRSGPFKKQQSLCTFVHVLRLIRAQRRVQVFKVLPSTFCWFLCAPACMSTSANVQKKQTSVPGTWQTSIFSTICNMRTLTLLSSISSVSRDRRATLCVIRKISTCTYMHTK